MPTLPLAGAEALLAEALARSPSVQAVQLVDGEGLVLVSTLSGGFDDDLAASSLSLVALAERVAGPCAVGALQSVRLRGAERQFLVIPVGDWALVVVADPYASADLIELQFSQIAARLLAEILQARPG